MRYLSKEAWTAVQNSMSFVAGLSRRAILPGEPANPLTRQLVRDWVNLWRQGGHKLLAFLESECSADAP